MEGCIFCRIINKELPSTIVYEDEKVLAFRDINPAAAFHVLIIPKQHIENVLAVDSNNGSLLVDIHIAAKKIAEKFELADKGFRLITNCGKGAGQTVFHLHYHMLSGDELGTRLL